MTAEPSDDISVRDNTDTHRFEILVGDKQAGFAAYRLQGDAYAFTHTEVTPACEGRGFGSRLVAHALEDARRKGLVVAPLCPFTAQYIKRHPEHAELVAPEHRRVTDAATGATPG